MKKIFLILAVLSVMLPGCRRHPQEIKLERVNISFQEWVGYGPLYLARDKGYLKEQGIELLFVKEELDSARQTAFQDGMLDFEAGTLDLLVNKLASDTPVLAVMVLDYSYGGDGIVTSEKIKKIEDLRRKKIALARDDVGETFLSYVLYKKYGIPLKEVSIIPCKTDNAWSVFVSAEADAVATWEPWLSKALKRPNSHVLISSREVPGVIVDTLNVRRDLVEKRPLLVKKLIRAWFKALEYFKVYPHEASRIIAKYYNMSAEEYLKSIEKLKWVDYPQQVKTFGDAGMLKTINAISEIKFQNGRIPKIPKADDALNREILERAYEDSN